MARTAGFISAGALAALVLLTSPAAYAQSASGSVDLTPKFADSGIQVRGLRAVEVGGIVVLRGETDDAATAESAGAFAQRLGYNRVANLIRVMTLPDDVAIQRVAERRLGQQRSLDGCSLHVDSAHGVVTVAGIVQHELQKDLAVSTVKNIDGVREVRIDLRRNDD